MRNHKELQAALDEKMESMKADFIGLPITDLSVKTIEASCRAAFDHFISHEMSQEEVDSIPNIHYLVPKAIIHGNNVSVVLILEDV